MKPYQLQRFTALLAILVPILMVLPLWHLNVFMSWGSLLFLLGAAGVLQTFLANQNLPFVCLSALQEPEEKTDFHHICATASLFACCIPGIVLGFSLYSRVNEPSSLGPILAIILLTFVYGLISYLVHFLFMALQPGAHTNPTREASWLQEHHYQLRRVFLFTVGVVACSTQILLISFMGPGEKYGIEIAQYDQLVDRLLSSAQEWLLILFHYSQLPWWVLVISLFYKLIFWSRGRLGFGSDNNPWILSNLTLVFGVISTIAILINMLVNLDTPYGFMLPIAPILTLLLSGGLSMWLSRTVRNQKLPKYQVETEFISPLLWTRVFQIACFAIIAFAMSIGGF